MNTARMDGVDSVAPIGPNGTIFSNQLFCPEGVNPFETVEWEFRDVQIRRGTTFGSVPRTVSQSTTPTQPRLSKRVGRSPVSRISSSRELRRWTSKMRESNATRSFVRHNDPAKEQPMSDDTPAGVFSNPLRPPTLEPIMTTTTTRFVTRCREGLEKTDPAVRA